MADLPIIVSVRVSDADGEIFSMPLYGKAADTVTLAQIVLAVAAVVTDLDAILDGKIVKLGACLDVALPGGLKTDAVGGAEIERTGLIPMVNADVPRTWSNDIPAFAYDKFVSGTNRINMTDSDVQAYLTNFSVNAGNIVWTDPYGNVLTDVKEGVKTFRKHRGQTKRT